MAEGRSGDSSLQDRRQEQIIMERNSSFRTFSGEGCRQIKSWEITGKFETFLKKYLLKKRKIISMALFTQW